jgi:hypothetical protein
MGHDGRPARAVGQGDGARDRAGRVVAPRLEQGGQLDVVPGVEQGRRHSFQAERLESKEYLGVHQRTWVNEQDTHGTETS